MVEIDHKKNLVTSLLFILKFQINWVMFIMISKIKHKIFQINLILELFICLILEWLELLKNLYSLYISNIFL
jgi:hypothetical protein